MGDSLSSWRQVRFKRLVIMLKLGIDPIAYEMEAALEHPMNQAMMLPVDRDGDKHSRLRTLLFTGSRGRFSISKRRIATSGTTFCSSVRELLNELALFAGAGGGILGGISSDGVASALSSTNHFKVVFSCSDRMTKFARQRPIWDDVRTFDGTKWRGNC